MKILSIKKSADFKNINQNGNKFFAKSLILLSDQTPEKYHYNKEKQQNAQDFCRVGYIVSKKIGNAVLRNKAKRRLREAVRKVFVEFAKKNRDYVIIARSQINEADFDKIISDLKFCIKRVDNNKNYSVK